MIKNNFKSVVVALLIAYLSLSESDNLKHPGFLDFPNADKVIHLGMYFTFMFVIAYENRLFSERKRNAFLIALIPFSYGLLMEACQALFTKTRTADIFDIIFNTLGILLAVGLWKIMTKPGSNRSY
jgi:VanZ family protein